MHDLQIEALFDGDVFDIRRVDYKISEMVKAFHFERAQMQALAGDVDRPNAVAVPLELKAGLYKVLMCQLELVLPIRLSFDWLEGEVLLLLSALDTFAFFLDVHV